MLSFDPWTKRWYALVSDDLYLWSDESAKQLQELIDYYELFDHDLKRLKKAFPRFSAS